MTRTDVLFWSMFCTYLTLKGVLFYLLLFS